MTLNATEIMADVNEWLLTAIITAKIADKVTNALERAVVEPNATNDKALAEAYLIARDTAKIYLRN